MHQEILHHINNQYTNEKEIIPICAVCTINADFFIWPKTVNISACNGVYMAKTKSECVRFVYCSGCACPCALYSKTG